MSENRQNPPDLDGVADLCEMQYLGEDNVLHNLKYRYDRMQIYTSTTTKVLIAVNPYESIPDCDTKETMQKYHDLPVDMEGFNMDDTNTGPDAFLVAHVAYGNLCSKKENQSCIVCGESGAGKTENAKLVMRFLAFSSTSNATDPQLYQEAEKVGQQVLDANPILETFGNAKTLLNNNSSRFGKFTKMLFTEHKDYSGDSFRTLAGAHINTYLLEKSRIVKQEAGERNFHSFYFVCTVLASTILPEIEIEGGPQNYHYTNQSGCYTKSGQSDDTEDFKEFLGAMETLRIDEEERKNILRVVAAILHLGNIEFVAEGQGSVIKNRDQLERLARVLQVDVKAMERRLTHETLVVVGNSYEKPLEPAKAADNRDSIAKGAYNGLFSYAVSRINRESSLEETKDMLWIGTLDVFGFEIFELNSFEQFCINFANERLQQYFNFHVLKSEQDLYLKEGLLWDPVDLPDNQDTINLVMRKTNGILAVLDSACIQPKAGPETFCNNLYKSCAHPKLRKATTRSGRSTGGRIVKMNGFMVKHYAGNVTYDAKEFLVKNNDKQVKETVELFQSSQNPVAHSCFPTPSKSEALSSTSNRHTRSRSVYGGRPRPSTSRAKKKASSFKSVGTTFCTQLASLMDTLNATTPYFIRCIKPNTTKKPKHFDPEYVRPQLRCGGLVQALTIIKCGFPVRCSYAKIWEIFGRALEGYSTPQNINFRDFAQAIMVKLGDDSLGPDDYQLGLSMVFFRPGKQGFLQRILSMDPTTLATSSVEDIRQFMVEKRNIRVRGALRAFIRIKHSVTFQRIKSVASTMRILERTMGRALKATRSKLGEAAEKAKREARLKDQEYLHALQCAKDLDVARDEWAKQRARTAGEIKDLEDKVAQFRQSTKDAKEALAAQKAKLQESERLKKEFQHKVSANTGKIAQLEDGLRKAQSQLRDKEARVTSLQQERDQIASRQAKNSESAARDLKIAEAQVHELNTALSTAKRHGLELSNELETLRSDVDNERSTMEHKLRQLQEDLEEERQRFRTASERNQRALAEKDEQLATLGQEHNFLNQQTSGKVSALQQELSDAAATLRQVQEESETALAKSDALVAAARDENASLTARLQAAQSARNDDARTAAEDMLRYRQEAEELSNELQARVDELEALLSQSQSDLAIANNKIDSLTAQLARDQQEYSEYKNQTDGKVQSLSSALEKAQNDLMSISLQSASDTADLQKQVTELRQELTTSGQEAQRVASDYERKLFDLEQSNTRKDQELSDLQATANHTASLTKNQLASLDTQMEEERKNFAERLGLSRQQAQEISHKFDEARGEFTADKSSWAVKEQRYQSENGELAAQVGTLSKDLKSLRDALAEEKEKQQRQVLASDEMMQESQRTHLRERQEWEVKFQDATREAARLQALNDEQKHRAESHAQEIDELKATYEARIQQAEMEGRAAEARVQGLEHAAQQELEEASAGLKGQCSLYQSTVESLRADKSSLMQVIATLRAQVRENASNAGRLNQEIASLTRTNHDASEQHETSLRQMREKHERDLAHHQDDLQQTERKVFAATQASQEAQAEAEALVRKQAQIEQRVRDLEKENVKLKSQSTSYKEEEKSMLESTLRLQEQLSAAQAAVVETKAHAQQEIAASRLAAQEAAALAEQNKARVSQLERDSVSHAAARNREITALQAEAGESMQSKLQAVEKRMDLEMQALKQENRALKVELQFLNLQSDVAKNSQRDLSDMRMKYERQLHALRSECHDATNELAELHETYEAYVQNAELMLQQKQAQFDYELLNQRRQLTSQQQQPPINSRRESAVSVSESNRSDSPGMAMNRANLTGTTSTRNMTNKGSVASRDPITSSSLSASPPVFLTRPSSAGYANRTGAKTPPTFGQRPRPLMERTKRAGSYAVGMGSNRGGLLDRGDTKSLRSLQASFGRPFDTSVGATSTSASSGRFSNRSRYSGVPSNRSSYSGVPSNLSSFSGSGRF